MKKKNLIIVLVILVSLMILVLSLVGLQKKGQIAKSLIDEILEKIDNQEDLLIYVTDKHENCYLCTDCNYIIDYYSDSFKLDFITFNKSDNSEDSYSKLLEKYDLVGSLKEPAVMMIRDGELKGIANEILTENLLKQFLIDFEFIDKQNENRDYQVGEEKFNKMLSSSEKSIFIVYTYEDSHYDVRKQFLELANKYNFSYGLIYSGVGNGAKVSKIISESLGDEYTLPLVIITQNGEIIDYINSVEEEKLVSFLKKNEIID